MRRAGAVVVVAVVAVAFVRGACVEVDHADAAAADFAAALRDAAPTLTARDLVLVQPPWREDVVDVLQPLTRATVTTAFAPKHGERWPPLVVVRDRQHPLPAVFGDHAQTPLAQHGDVDVVRVGDSNGNGNGNGNDNDGGVDDFDLAAADVFVDVDGAKIPCPWVAGEAHHVCRGLPEWMKVGTETLTIAGHNERCIWAHPKTGAELVIAYGDVDSSAGVTVSAAFSDVAADNRAGKDVAVDVALGDQHAVLTAAAGHRGFSSVRVKSPGAHAPLTLTLTTAHDGQRHLCYRLRRGTR